MASISKYESEQIDKANATGLEAVVFIHGLWLLPSSWDRWVTVFEQAGYAALTPGDAGADEAAVMRQAFAGMLWGKQFYHLDVNRWLDGDPAGPPEAGAPALGVGFASAAVAGTGFAAVTGPPPTPI